MSERRLIYQRIPTWNRISDTMEVFLQTEPLAGQPNQESFESVNIIRIAEFSSTAALAEFLRTTTPLITSMPVTFQSYSVDLIVINQESGPDDKQDKVIIARVRDETSMQTRMAIFGRVKD